MRTATAARRAAAGRADGHLSDRRRFHHLLDASHVPRQAAVEVPRRASFLRRAGMDLGGAVSSGQSVPRHASLADVIMLLAGISPNVFVVLGPITIAHSAFVHANLDWTLGPFKYVIASPVFHRWHHTAADRGGEKNFAATFPVLDLHVRHVLHAGGRTARPLRHRRAFPTELRQPAHASVHAASRGSRAVAAGMVKRASPRARRADAANLQFVHQFAVN